MRSYSLVAGGQRVSRHIQRIQARHAVFLSASSAPGCYQYPRGLLSERSTRKNNRAGRTHRRSVVVQNATAYILVTRPHLKSGIIVADRIRLLRARGVFSNSNLGRTFCHLSSLLACDLWLSTPER